MVTLAALLWLASQNAAFLMLDRDGSVLTVTGPVCPSDARLRRAQATADRTETALQIARELITQKLAGQEMVAGEKLKNSDSAGVIRQARESVGRSTRLEEILFLEAKAAAAYWSAWSPVPVQFPKVDTRRIPHHWLTFGTRQSPLTGSPRLAVNPLNAMLNYLYAVLESETRLAAAALGLDPGLGFFHNDKLNRDSLACDLMEPIRPMVDDYLFGWIIRTPLRKECFFEERNGNCRLMGSFAAQLSETSLLWRRAIAPVAEQVTKLLWSGRTISRRKLQPTRLTQNHRREVKGGAPFAAVRKAIRQPMVCLNCGSPASSGSTYCYTCVPSVSRTNLIEVAKLGRLATHTPAAEALRSETQRRQMAARKAWNPKDKPEWLDKETYKNKIQPRLKAITVPVLMKTLSVSEPYATSIRSGQRVPHARHWMTLAELAGYSR